jgi:hypothetical protein
VRRCGERLEVIRTTTDAEIQDLARNLVATDGQHLFGDNEFTIRNLTLRIAAKAIEQHLAQEKRLPRRQRNLPAL